MKWLLIVVGVILVLLGGLWFLQGTGLVTIQPILCVADCAPLEGGSATWTIVGLVAFIIGASVLWSAGRRFRPNR
jgi:hypothetical protein